MNVDDLLSSTMYTYEIVSYSQTDQIYRASGNHNSSPQSAIQQINSNSRCIILSRRLLDNLIGKKKKFAADVLLSLLLGEKHKRKTNKTL